MIPEEWRSATYGDALIESEERAGERIDLPVLSVTKSRGPMLASERFGRVMHSRDLSRYRVARRDSIVADPMLLWDGSIGRQAVVDAGLVSPDYRVYEPASDCDPAFLGYLVRSPQMLPHYQGGARGTNVRRNRIARTDFRAIPIALPPMREQQRIAVMLTILDDAIEASQAVIGQLDATKGAMMTELFSQGLPGRHRRFKLSPLGKIPESWDVVRVGDVCESITKGATPAQQTRDVGEVPFLKVYNIARDGNIDLEYQPTFIPRAVHEGELRRSRTYPGDVLMNIVGPPLGKVAVVPASIEQANINQAIAVFRPRAVEPEFLALCLSVASLFSWALERAKRTSTQLNLTLELCREYPMPLPPADERLGILGLFEAVDSRRNIELATLSATRNVKQALLSALLTGEIRVPLPPEANTP